MSHLQEPITKKKKKNKECKIEWRFLHCFGLICIVDLLNDYVALHCDKISIYISGYKYMWDSLIRKGKKNPKS